MLIRKINVIMDLALLVCIKDMAKRPAKIKVNQSLLGAAAGVVVGVIAGVGAMFLSKEENRQKVKKVAGDAVKKGKVGLAKVEREVKKDVLLAKRKLAKRK